MLYWKVDVLEELKKAGYSSYRLRKEKIFGEANIQRLRTKGNASMDTLGTICKLLNCDISDIIGTDNTL